MKNELNEFPNYQIIKLASTLFIKFIFLRAHATKVHHAADEILEFNFCFEDFFADKRMSSETVQYKFHQQSSLLFVGSGI